MQHQFQVSGMSCGHCVRAVTAAVHGVDPAAMVEVNLSGRTVTVQSGADGAALGGAIVSAGYDVQAAAA